MPKLAMTISHSLQQDEAVGRVKDLLKEVRTKFADKITNVVENWTIGNQGTFSFDAMGFSVAGILTVTENAVKIDGKLPFAAALFKGRIEAAIREEAEKLLA